MKLIRETEKYFLYESNDDFFKREIYKYKEIQRTLKNGNIIMFDEMQIEESYGFGQWFQYVFYYYKGKIQ